MSASVAQSELLMRLEAFLAATAAATGRLEPPPEQDVRQARDHAEALIDQLRLPVRVAVSGARGAGKSSLVNLLAGADILPPGPDTHLLPPIILRHATRERTLAGWWDRPEKAFDGLNLTAALAESPDVISFEIDCEALEALWLIDVSGVDHPSGRKEALFALSMLADVLLWCSDATKPATEEELGNWQLLPPHLRRHSVLVLSHADLVDERRAVALQAVSEEQRQSQFQHSVPIAIPLAWQALVSDGDAGPALWADSGAADLMETLSASIETCRADRLQRLRRTMQRFVQPVMDRVGVACAVAGHAGGAAQAPDGQPVETPVTPDGADGAAAQADTMRALLGRWSRRLIEYRSRARRDELADLQLIEEAHALVNGFLEELVAPGALPRDVDWVVAEFEKADDLLILMQYEDAAHVVTDAMRILLQLSDVLCWAGFDDTGACNAGAAAASA